MIAAQFHLNHPLLQSSLQRIPRTRIDWVRGEIQEDATRVVVRDYGDDLDTVESALEDDGSISDLVRIIDGQDSRFYRFELAGQAQEADLFPWLHQHDVIIRSASAGTDGWDCEVVVPDFTTARSMFDRFSTFNLKFDVRKMYAGSRPWNPTGLADRTDVLEI